MKQLLLIFFLGYALNAATIKVTDDSIKAGDQVHWTADNTYMLYGLVYVEAGARLTIDAGTVIKANQPSVGATALIICRGARIYAQGTKTAPIIFTAEADDPYKVDDWDKENYMTGGQWGGVVILGNASISYRDATYGQGIRNIEGIDPGESRAYFGGGTTPDDNDTSGVFSYVSIRYPGFTLSPGNEINGLTLGGVGRGTKIDHVEVYRCGDDSFEWFGGTVQCKYLIAAFAGDDGFDWDDGWRGRGQYWVMLKGDVQCDGCMPDNGGEHSSSMQTPVLAPIASPIISNATYIGDLNQWALYFKEGTRGYYFNSIIEFWKHGVNFNNRIPGDALENAFNDSIKLVNVTWWNIGSNEWYNPTTTRAVVHQQTYSAGVPNEGERIVAKLKSWNNAIQNPQHFYDLPGTGMEPSWTSGKNGLLDLRPCDKANYLINHPTATDVNDEHSCFRSCNLEAIDLDGKIDLASGYKGGNFFDIVDFRGAFSPYEDTTWWVGWTALDAYGYLGHNFKKTTSLEKYNCTVGISSKPMNKQSFEISNRNNNIHLSLNGEGALDVSLYSLNGKLVKVLYSGVCKNSLVQIPLKSMSIHNGTYIVRANYAGINSSKVISIVSH